MCADKALSIFQCPYSAVRFSAVDWKKTASLPALTGHDNGENGIGGTKSPYFLHRRLLEERINDSKNFACIFRVS